MTTTKITTLDVRADFRAGHHPCDKIQNALNQVGQDAALRLLVPFEPVPLYEAAATKGLAHSATRSPEGDWEVLFTRLSVPTPATAAAAVSFPACGCGCSETSPAEVLDVDARGLEPPQPMVKILETLSALPANAAVRARTDRRPVHLYPLLEARGFAGESEEQSDGSFVTHIRRP
jgi:uncharacterized protein (DUF2249 family)